jgi:hypothetical protein
MYPGSAGVTGPTGQSTGNTGNTGHAGVAGPVGPTGPGVYGAFATSLGVFTGSGLTIDDGVNPSQGSNTGPTGGLFIVPFYDPHVLHAVWFSTVYNNQQYNPYDMSPSGTTALTGGTGSTGLYGGGGRALLGTFSISNG